MKVKGKGTIAEPFEPDFTKEDLQCEAADREAQIYKTMKDRLEREQLESVRRENKLMDDLGEQMKGRMAEIRKRYELQCEIAKRKNRQQSANKDREEAAAIRWKPYQDEFEVLVEAHLQNGRKPQGAERMARRTISDKIADETGERPSQDTLRTRLRYQK